MKIILSVILSFFSYSILSQTNKEIAVKNFESFFEFFHNSYPADQNTYYFKDFSDLEIKYAIPNELEMMMNFDTSNFYHSYMFFINTKMDTLIKIEELSLDSEVKKIYADFKESILKGERTGQFNYQNDKVYSDSLRAMLYKSTKPQIGYVQTATLVSQKKRKRKKESKILIEYNNKLKVINFGNIEE